MAVFKLPGISILLLLIKIECAGANTCLHETTQIITATQHKEADLPCFITATRDSRRFTVKWTKHSSQLEEILVWPVEQFETSDLKRVALKWGADGVRVGNMSLSLKGVNRSDEGMYICNVSSGADCVLIKNITLKVKDCEILDQVEVTHNQTATLPCSNLESETLRISKASWVIVKDHSETVILQYPPDNLNTTSVAKRARFTGHPNSGHSSLYLLNVEYIDSQWYRCNLTTEQDERCFDVKLLVKKKDHNPAVWMSTTTEPDNMNEETPAVTESWDTHARLSMAMASTIALALSVMVVMTIVLGVTIGLRRCRPSASHSILASEDPLWHTYEDVDHLGMTTNSLYAFSQLKDNAILHSFKSL